MRDPDTPENEPFKRWVKLDIKQSSSSEIRDQGWRVRGKHDTGPNKLFLSRSYFGLESWGNTPQTDAKQTSIFRILIDSWVMKWDRWFDWRFLPEGVKRDNLLRYSGTLKDALHLAAPSPVGNKNSVIVQTLPVNFICDGAEWNRKRKEFLYRHKIWWRITDEQAGFGQLIILIMQCQTYSKVYRLEPQAKASRHAWASFFICKRLQTCMQTHPTKFGDCMNGTTLPARSFQVSGNEVYRVSLIGKVRCLSWWDSVQIACNSCFACFVHTTQVCRMNDTSRYAPYFSRHWTARFRMNENSSRGSEKSSRSSLMCLLLGVGGFALGREANACCAGMSGLKEAIVAIVVAVGMWEKRSVCSSYHSFEEATPSRCIFTGLGKKCSEILISGSGPKGIVVVRTTRMQRQMIFDNAVKGWARFWCERRREAVAVEEDETWQHWSTSATCVCK